MSGTEIENLESEATSLPLIRRPSHLPDRGWLVFYYEYPDELSFFLLDSKEDFDYIAAASEDREIIKRWNELRNLEKGHGWSAQAPGVQGPWPFQGVEIVDTFFFVMG